MIATAAAELGQQLGIDTLGQPTAITPGLGGNELWRLPTGGTDQLLRIFPPGATHALADRETAAHVVAAENGVRAPRITGSGWFNDRPVLCMEWVDGVSVTRALGTGRPPERIGWCCGEVLATLHRISSVPEVIGERDWIACAASHTEELGPRLTRFRDDHRLLHLDFHPDNLIIDAEERVWVLDWANVRVGPAAADLARTLSIIELARDALPGFTDDQREKMSIFWSALLAGYAATGGEVSLSPLIMAWAYATQLGDLAGSSTVPGWYFERLGSRYRNLIAEGS